MALLFKSLNLLFQNYLLINDHYLNVTVFIFHTGDFTEADVDEWERLRLFPSKCRGTLQLINLLGSPFWKTPSHLNERDLIHRWSNPKFNLGYRHMIRWYAVRVWDYFDEINRMVGTNYQYIMRMDEESFLHSPIQYDLFGYMSRHDYLYAYRQCSYEMNAIKKIFHNYTGAVRTTTKNGKNANWTMNRNFNGGSCGFYNNWFLGSLQFFRSTNVQHLLQWFDHEGFMYLDRLNDLVIQTAAVYAYCPTAKIHRFLDWSYEHFTILSNSTEEQNIGCPIWGALSTGYLDPNSEQLVSTFLERTREANCTIDDLSSSRRKKVPQLHVSRDHVRDLSPTYNHLPPNLRNMTILSVKAGKIDMPGRGEQSG